MIKVYALIKNEYFANHRVNVEVIQYSMAKDTLDKIAKELNEKENGYTTYVVEEVA